MALQAALAPVQGGLSILSSRPPWALPRVYVLPKIFGLWRVSVWCPSPCPSPALGLGCGAGRRSLGAGRFPAGSGRKKGRSGRAWVRGAARCPGAAGRRGTGRKGAEGGGGNRTASQALGQGTLVKRLPAPEKGARRGGRDQVDTRGDWERAIPCSSPSPQSSTGITVRSRAGWEEPWLAGRAEDHTPSFQGQGN